MTTALINDLKLRLAEPLPGERAQWLMAPATRTRSLQESAEPSAVRQSAVLLYLFPTDTGWHIVLIKRTEYEGVHGGQVCLPGGRLENGETHRQAALREFHEEIGVAVENDQLLGELSNLYIPPSKFMVHPFIAYTQARPRYRCDALEVERVVELPVDQLLGDSIVKRGLVQLGSGDRVETPYFDVDGLVVWGATAMILSEFKVLLRAGRTPFP